MSDSRRVVYCAMHVSLENRQMGLKTKFDCTWKERLILIFLRYDDVTGASNADAAGLDDV